MIDVNASNVFNILHIDVEYEFFHILLELRPTKPTESVLLGGTCLSPVRTLQYRSTFSAYTVKLEYINSNNDPNDATISMHSRLRINKYTLSLI